MGKATKAGVALALAGTLWGAGLALAASPNIVISEFRTRGPSGTKDEFVELWNNSSVSVNIGGWKLNDSSNAGMTGTVATINAGVTVGPGCYFLLTNTSGAGYSGSVPGDQTFTKNIADDGGVAIVDASSAVVDQVGMSAGSAYKEGTTLPAEVSNVDQSFERKPGGVLGDSQDLDNNNNDFLVHATSSNPQNSLSSCYSSTAVSRATWGAIKMLYR